MQHKSRCVNSIGRGWIACKTNRITPKCLNIPSPPKGQLKDLPYCEKVKNTKWNLYTLSTPHVWLQIGSNVMRTWWDENMMSTVVVIRVQYKHDSLRLEIRMDNLENGLVYFCWACQVLCNRARDSRCICKFIHSKGEIAMDYTRKPIDCYIFSDELTTVVETKTRN